MSTHPTQLSRHHAFTLIELLVVISIIGLLVGLVVASGAKMIVSQKQNQTKNILRALDRSLEEFMSENSNRPPIVRMTQFANMPGLDLYTGDNAVDLGGEHPLDQPPSSRPFPNLNSSSNAYMRYTPDNTIYPRYPDASVFIEAVQGFGVVDAILADLGDRLIPTPSDSPGGSNSNTAPSITPSVVDGWYADEWASQGQRWPLFEGVPILYVTANNDMANFLYGQTINKRPYFMSAGIDRHYGTTNEYDSTRRDSTRNPNKTVAAIEALNDNLYSYDVGGPNLSPDFTQDYR